MAFAGENSIDMIVAYLAIVGVGAVAVPLSPINPTTVIEHELAAVGAGMLVVGSGTSIDISVPTVAIVEIRDLDHGDAPIVDCAADDLAVLLFTSGTAGAPKAAMLSHGNLLSNQQQTQSGPEPLLVSDVVLGVLPLDHIFGLNVMLGITLAAGASLVIVPRFEAVATAATVARNQVTVISGVPAMWAQFVANESIPADSFSSVRFGFSGAAPLPNELVVAMRERFDVTLSEGYGLTEASPVVTTSAGQVAVPGSVGRVVPGVEVRLVDDEGSDVLDGDPGEMWVRGPNVFLGYWNDAEATSRVLTIDGWLRTGDIATVDDSGRLYLVNRSKDLIIVSGFNVFPAEVEQVLATHPTVAESAVVGIAHSTTGEAVKAYVVLNEGALLDPADLVAHCRKQLARYKCPSEIVAIEELPKGAGGKVLRRLLR